MSDRRAQAGCRNEGGRYVLREHARECVARDCPGCLPCSHDEHGNPVRHCPLRRRCTSHLQPHEQVCPGCLAKLRSVLAQILDAAAMMLDVAIDDGLESAAANLAGPVANPVLHRWRLINARRQGVDVEEPDDRDPYTALATRERMIREELGHDETTLCSETLSGSVDYLRWVLDDLAGDAEHLPLLLDLRETADGVLAHLEAVAHDSRQPERGALCPACPEPVTDDDPAPPRLVRRWAHWCDREDCTREHDTSGARDTWVCPRNRDHWWTEAEYRMWVSEDFLTYAVRLTAKQIETQYDIKPATLRKRVERGQIKRAGVDQWGRAQYDVTQLRDTALGVVLA